MKKAQEDTGLLLDKMERLTMGRWKRKQKMEGRREEGKGRREKESKGQRCEEVRKRREEKRKMKGEDIGRG